MFPCSIRVAVSSLPYWGPKMGGLTWLHNPLCIRVSKAGGLGEALGQRCKSPLTALTGGESA